MIEVSMDLGGEDHCFWNVQAKCVQKEGKSRTETLTDIAYAKAADVSEKGGEREECGDKEEDYEGCSPGWYSICANAGLAVSLSFWCWEGWGTHAKYGFDLNCFIASAPRRTNTHILQTQSVDVLCAYVKPAAHTSSP